MAGGFPKAPALRAARFARCCTAPLRSLICHCVHLLSLLSLSLCLPLRSQPCCRDLQFYAGPKPALVVRLASLRVSRICTMCDLLCSTSMAKAMVTERGMITFVQAHVDIISVLTWHPTHGQLSGSSQSISFCGFLHLLR